MPLGRRSGVYRRGRFLNFCPSGRGRRQWVVRVPGLAARVPGLPGRRTPPGEPASYAAADLEAALAVPEDRRAAGFFDVDNTMMQGASIYYLARGLASRKYFTTGDLLRFGMRQLRFRVLATEHGGDMSQTRQAALAFVAGRAVAELRD